MRAAEPPSRPPLPSSDVRPGDGLRGFVLTPTYRVAAGTPVVHLHGVLENGQPCLLADDRVRPYFYVPAAAADEVRRLAPHAGVATTGLHTFAMEPVAEVTTGVPGDVPALRRRLEAAGIACFEADVRFAYRYLIDRGIRGGFVVRGPSEPHPALGRVYRNPAIEPAHWAPELRVLSVDLETSLRGDQIYSIALHAWSLTGGRETPSTPSAGMPRSLVLIASDRCLDGAESLPTEEALLRRFLELLRDIDPDVITGWNVVDFDLAVLQRRCHRYRLRCALGRSDDELEIRKDASFTRESRAVLGGRLVLDALSLLRGAFIKLEDYKLETAAQAFLGRGKLMTGPGRHREIEDAYRHDPQRLVDYNLNDARLVAEILEATKLIELAVNRSLLTGMPLDRVSAAIASVDSLYLAEARRRGVVTPSVSTEVKDARLTGGYVMESQPGLYENILVFDFKSLYPSIIRTFNLDPLTLAGTGDRSPAAVSRDAVGSAVADQAGLPAPPADPGADAGSERAPAPPLVRNSGPYPHSTHLQAPNGAWFRRQPQGILPELVARLAREREQAKRAGNAVASNAIKILMNSMYGVLGAGASRLFSPEVANAITHFGQYLIQHAAERVRSRGFAVIYGDTDSLFVDIGEPDPARALERGADLGASLTQAVAAHIREAFACESFLELEFEKLYRRFFMPELRGGGGSKKRYAGLVTEAGGERIEFVGLESVRRDWTEVSKRLQYELLDRVFHDRPVDAFVREFVAQLRGGAFDDLLVYKKAVRKELDAYTKTTPPHVRAARLSGQTGRIVEYVMTAKGPEPVGRVTAPLDYAHYIEHQLKPVADAILRFLSRDFDDLIGARKQLALF